MAGEPEREIWRAAPERMAWMLTFLFDGAIIIVQICKIQE